MVETFEKVGAFNSHLHNDISASSFKPPGELLETYTSKERNFEIWSGELTDPAVQRLIERIQIMISFFIEGGTPLLLDDQDWTLARWRVFFVYVINFNSRVSLTMSHKLRKACRFTVTKYVRVLHSRLLDLVPIRDLRTHRFFQIHSPGLHSSPSKTNLALISTIPGQNLSIPHPSVPPLPWTWHTPLPCNGENIPRLPHMYGDHSRRPQ